MTTTDPAALADRVADGELRIHELEDHADYDTAAEARRLLVERETGADLEAVADYTFDAEQADPNVDNMIGAAQVPMGVAGPVPVDGSAAEGDYYLPLATTEGALLASVNRGLSTIRSVGGATTRVTKNGMTRAPVFRVGGVAEAAEVVEWVADNVDRLREAAESTTSHGELLDVEPYVVGDSVYLRFAYDTKDAMGMNMVTIATGEACELVEEETPADLVALSGNLCSDKKPAAINAVEGRGRSVTADVLIPGDVVEDRLHTTPEAIAEANTRKNLTGSAKAGSLGFNAHAANVVAAAFLATGQDEAQVVEGANAITTMDARENDEGTTDLYASVSLASLEVGTVGGGTKLPTQAEALEILGLRGGGDPAGSNAAALAEVIAVGSLAGELSLLAALSSRHLVSAHEDLGR
ncbi:hydroxymethylglutaryl-CoA reductase (NADPH) [Natronobacterium gregoryi]|uniref:3-hydroxy-3-methylglutaryl coenzyme A reductase n=2 Tax=Natronobacterium gregoryi TaxID=44930 RepID=L0AFX2_NATGS|nr:hydroxymethylglutaryl-CoA reductase (NADPH) [Natronobacterium gregoryi]AFZ72334.1 NADP-dependent hydroxymethylglutaryl-CoA reductase [Natronobacterium gregoryi SP2]ELY64281.1 3-hydroxy-3-methylglutaryl-CoA reductase [Natronobacterium gregoryi SP2]PLK20350.1 hydroxymethylglutaryl-CoA reductase (NADPH) [Natronobacterium gregoryi SP2]SFJ23262.1 3-hydroxy-3-methylglutaryl-coenzyme A reductase [Natronobacterium gregoryi]